MELSFLEGLTLVGLVVVSVAAIAWLPIWIYTLVVNLRAAILIEAALIVGGVVLVMLYKGELGWTPLMFLPLICGGVGVGYLLDCFFCYGYD